MGEGYEFFLAKERKWRERERMGRQGEPVQAGAGAEGWGGGQFYGFF